MSKKQQIATTKKSDQKRRLKRANSTKLDSLKKAKHGNLKRDFQQKPTTKKGAARMKNEARKSPDCGTIAESPPNTQGDLGGQCASYSLWLSPDYVLRRSDIRLIEQAARHDWDAPGEVKQILGAKVSAILSDPTANERLKMAATSALIQMTSSNDRADIRDQVGNVRGIDKLCRIPTKGLSSNGARRKIHRSR
jgi:hypothetical protein